LTRLGCVRKTLSATARPRLFVDGMHAAWSERRLDSGLCSRV
jgi:hypothetical protein